MIINDAVFTNSPNEQLPVNHQLYVALEDMETARR